MFQWRGTAQNPEEGKGIIAFMSLVLALLQNRNVGDALLPLGGTGLVDAGAFGVDGHRYGHVFYLELVDTFHTEIFERQLAGVDDGFGDEVGGASNGHEVDGAEF